jgi:hypothetical protein
VNGWLQSRRHRGLVTYCRVVRDSENTSAARARVERAGEMLQDALEGVSSKVVARLTTAVDNNDMIQIQVLARSGSLPDGVAVAISDLTDACKDLTWAIAADTITRITEG